MASICLLPYSIIIIDCNSIIRYKILASYLAVSTNPLPRGHNHTPLNSSPIVTPRKHPL